MSSSGLLLLNTTVEVLVKSHYGKIGRVAGHVIDSVKLQPLNVVHIANDHGTDVLELDGKDMKEAAYDAAVWRYNCWTPPAGK